MLTDEYFTEKNRIETEIESKTREIKGLMGMSYLIQKKREELKNQIAQLNKELEVFLMFF